MKKLVITMVLMFFCFCNAFGEELVFVHITDSHVGKNKYLAERLIFDMVQVYQDPEIKIVIATGDNVQLGKGNEYQQYSQIVALFPDLYWYSIPGNHDLHPDSFENYVGDLQWAYDVGEYRLIGINTNSVDFSQLDAWLASSDKINIVFGHHPLQFCSGKVRAKLRDRFQKYGVLMYVCGHTNGERIVMDVCGTLTVTGHTTGIGCYQVIRVDGRQISEITTKCPNLFANFKGQWSGKWFASPNKKKPVLSGVASLNLSTVWGVNLIGKLTIKNSIWGTMSVPLSGQLNDEDNTLNMAGIYKYDAEYQIVLDGAVKFDSLGGTIDGSIKIDGEEAGTFSVFSPILKELSFW